MRDLFGVPIGANAPTAVLGVHLLLAGFFLVSAATMLTGGGELLGVALQALIAVLVAALGVPVARIVRDQ